MVKEKQTSTRGLIMPILEKIVNGATWVSRRCLGNAPPAGKDLKPEVVAETARCVDIYVLACIVIEILAYLLVSFLPTPRPYWAYILLVLIGLRVIDMVGTAIRIPLFDIMHREEPQVASNPRVVILGLVNYGELILCFGTFYAFFQEYIGHGESTILDNFSPLYLSMITQSTIGYGDLWPTAGLRWLACLQTFAAILILILIIGRFVTNLPKAKGMDESNTGSETPKV